MADVSLTHGPGPFAASSMYRDRIAPDEANFLDLAHSVALATTESIVIDGRTDLKLVILAGKTFSANSQEFADQWLAGYARSISECVKFRDLVRGFRFNWILSPITTFAGMPAPALNFIECVQEFWFDNEKDLEDAVELPAFQRPPTDPSRSMSFVARELVYFEDGRPCGSASPAGNGGSDFAVR